MNRLFSELRRRAVFRVAAAYCVAAWLLIQVAATIFPILGLPDSATRFVLVLLLLGFLVALVLSWALRITPEGIRREQDPAGPEDGGAESRGGPGRAPTRALAVGVAALVALGGVWLSIGRLAPGEAGEVLDANAVAVLPFRVAGADPSLAYLREGMLDLLSTKLTGEGGPRAVDPRTVMSAWRRATPDEAQDLAMDSVLALARGLRAGQILQGGVVGTPDRLVLSASVLDVASGAVLARADVQGPQDSLPVLTDRLAAALLSLHAGEDERSLSALTSTSLSALRAFLAGRSAYRSGRYVEAEQEFSRALQLDSTFALAYVGLADAMSFSPSASMPRSHILDRAWRHRSRLSERDRVVVGALLGPNYPQTSSIAEVWREWMRALDAHPDRPEVWYYAGDDLFHTGAIVGETMWREKAAEYFRNAVRLDSTFAPALMHLVQLEGSLGDTAAVRRLSSSYLSRNSSGETAEHLRWYAAAVLGDTATLAELRGGMDRMSLVALLFTAVAYGVYDGVRLQDADAAMEVFRRRTGTPAEQRFVAMESFAYDLNRGRPRAAAAAIERLRGFAPRLAPRLHVLSAIYSVGDPGRAAEAARALATSLAAPDAEGDDAFAQRSHDRCVLGQWGSARGDLKGAAESAGWLRRAARDGSEATPARQEAHARNRICALLLEAQLATARRDANASHLVEQLDSILLAGPPAWGPPDHLNAALARLHQAHGRPRAALAAIRRRSFGLPGVLFLADHLREEGRLAALVGDTGGAVRAYRHYLALREVSEPSLGAEVERVRAELAALERR